MITLQSQFVLIHHDSSHETQMCCWRGHIRKAASSVVMALSHRRLPGHCHIIIALENRGQQCKSAAQDEHSKVKSKAVQDFVAFDGIGNQELKFY